MAAPARALRRRRCSGGSPVGWSGLWAAATSMAAAVLGSRGGGSRGRRRHQAQIDEKPSVRGRAKEEVIWGGLLSRVKPPPGTKSSFVPGGGFTRDKRCFLAGRENSQPAAHL